MHKLMSPHGDYDHMENTILLVDNFEVDNVIDYCSDKRILSREYELV